MESLNPSDPKMITRLLAALPKEFEFYHLGKVKLQEAALASPRPDFFPAASEDQVPAIGYSFRGDVTGVLILGVPGGADLSVYAELGNIIASQIATQLATQDGLDVMISAPNFLSSSALRKLVSGGTHIESRTYLHHLDQAAIAISAWIVPSTFDAAARNV